MKKTLIALMALAGMASATEFSSNSYLSIDGSVYWDAEGTDQASKDLFSICVGKTADEIKAAYTAYNSSGTVISGAPIYATGLASGTQLNARSFTLSGMYNATTLDESVELVSYSFISRSDSVVTTGVKMQVSDSNGNVLGISDTVTYDSNATTSGVYGVGTFSFSGSITLSSTAEYTFTIVNADTLNAYTGKLGYGEFKTYYSNNNGFKIDGLAANEYHPVVSIVTKTIPEPSTATLSLLALAGLAARRRRK